LRYKRGVSTRDPGSPPDPDASEIDDARAAALAEASFVAFFQGLDRRTRAELQRLADADRRFGEDVAAELAAPPPRGGSGS
jgi:hypothetical protein